MSINYRYDPHLELRVDACLQTTVQGNCNIRPKVYSRNGEIELIVSGEFSPHDTFNLSFNFP